MAKANQPRITVIVPAYNEAKRIGICLSALKQQTLSPDLFEVIVVDNNSTDHTAEVVTQMGFPCLREPRRYAEVARNTGVRNAKGEILAFTDADCRPDSQWLETALAYIDQNRVDVLAGKILFTFSDEKDIWELYDSLFNLQHDLSVKDRGLGFTANLLIRKKVFESCGGFPEDSYCGGDVVLTERATNLGFKIFYCEQAIVAHPARKYIPLIKKAVRIGKGKGTTIFRKRGAEGRRIAYKKPHILNLWPPRLVKRLRSVDAHLSLKTVCQLYLCNLVYLGYAGIGFFHGLTLRLFNK